MLVAPMPGRVSGKETWQHATYIPKSKMLFCICFKCGTTSLYQYIFGAVRGQSWCDFAGQYLGVRTKGKSAMSHAGQDGLVPARPVCPSLAGLALLPGQSALRAPQPHCSHTVSACMIAYNDS